MEKRFVPLSIPNFEGNESKYVNEALSQGWVSTGGAYIVKLEESMAAFLEAEDVAACQSGTAAIHLSLVDAGIGPGDVVLVPPLTFIAAVNPVKYQFATPVFIDCDDSLCMDPDKLERFCKEQCRYDGNVLKYKNQPVKALVVVHVFGNLADMEKIMSVAGKYSITVIEDATEALGSRYSEGIYKGKYAGTIGDYGTYSFNGNKIITTGGGGAVTAKNPARVKHIRYLSTQAKDDEHYYVHNEVGYNYRMTNLQAALGVGQMELLPEFIDRKRNNYNRYKELLSGLKCARLLDFRPNTFSNMWFYSLLIDTDKVSKSLRTIITELGDKGVQSRAIWDLINKQIPYKDEETFELEKAFYYADRVLNIPCSTNLTEEDIIYVSKSVTEVLESK